MRIGWVLRVVAAVLRRPSLWTTACRQTHRMAGRGWWRRPPFLPLPDSAYARFRGVTQYGDPDREPAIADVVVWLEWAREFGKATGLPRPGDPT